MNIKEKVAYLSGLMDGLEFDRNTKEGKVFDAILDVLDEIADEMDIMEEELDDLRDFVEALDEDMEELEDFLDLDEDDDDEDDDVGDQRLRLKCPECGHVNLFDPEVIWTAEDDVEILCSNCEAVIFSSDEFAEDFDDDDDDDDD
ncbi:MAG: hypothetical protein LBH09_04780 [Peptococcaceae bacterium]|jgi:hypothetical protein|nr:hypothetical protein [Peptococcaceae bacterium]